MPKRDLELPVKIKKVLKELPFAPGVYFFRDKKGRLIYIGKAASLHDRVGSYFSMKNNQQRPIEWVLEKIATIDFETADSVLEAYFLEQKLIKKYRPTYNVLGKDDKSFCFVITTREKFPRVLVIRETDKKSFLSKTEKGAGVEKIWGPFASKRTLEEALKILRKIFPFHSNKQPSEERCFEFSLGLCPGPYAGKISVADYRKNILAIGAILSGRKKLWLKKKELEMKSLAKKEQFEKAALIRNQIFALKRLRDISLLKEDKDFFLKKQEVISQKRSYRIEGFDISSLAGGLIVGSMVVFSGKEALFSSEKAQYRKFQIKNLSVKDDLGAMREVLKRRAARKDWAWPDLILVDGGAEHLKLAQKIFAKEKKKVTILAVAKGPERKKLDLRWWGKKIALDKKIIAQIRDEAHRFAITYHRKIRKKAFLETVQNLMPKQN